MQHPHSPRQQFADDYNAREKARAEAARQQMVDASQAGQTKPGLSRADRRAALRAVARSEKKLRKATLDGHRARAAHQGRADSLEAAARWARAEAATKAARQAVEDTKSG